MDIQYIGELLWPGKLGHFFAITSFVAALFSAFSYFRAAQTENCNPKGSMAWLLLGRNGFVIHTATVAGVFITLFYLISNHFFEYHYVWQHSDLSLSPKYLLSCFWEGQQGSFLLWSIWHCVLGLIVMRTAKGLESRVMAVIAVVQVLLATMLLGFQFTPDISIGTSPFMLLRDKMAGAPIFSDPNYLATYITDGNGLNELLQNYWMVIHPPVLFLGFASTIIPFAYTIATLWKGEYKAWVRPARIWSLFSGAALGTGIMMGGAWAYESLTFGGYWAWDPVENASLVPWLTLIAGLHTLIIYKATGRSFIMTVIMLTATYMLIWYSTFLTRTGVLGDTSVHAFTGEGKSLYWHLLIVMGILLSLIIGLLIKRWKSLPRVKGEEQLSSREFWMFIGSFVLFLSALQIIISTSIPVWSPLAKWITGNDVAPPINPVDHYNSIQVWVAIVIALLSGSILYLKFKKSDPKTVWKRLALTGIIGLVVAIIIGYVQQILAPQYFILLFATCFSIVATIYYAISIQKAKLMKLGAAISHLGFGLSLLGILLSSYNKEVMSINTMGVVFNFGGTQDENFKESRDNVLLFKDNPVVMGEYTATYLGDSTVAGDKRTFFKVKYVRTDTVTGKVKEEFMLTPNAFVNTKGNNGLNANPDSKHYITRDIFTYVTQYLAADNSVNPDDYKSQKMKVGDTVFLNNGYMVFDGFNKNAINDANYKPEPNDIAVAVMLKVYDLKGQIDSLAPIFILRDQKYVTYVEDTLDRMKVYTHVANILPDEDAIELKVKELKPQNEYIVMKALVFPYINVLWLGIIVMVIGFLLSMVNRIKKKEKG